MLGFIKIVNAKQVKPSKIYEQPKNLLARHLFWVLMNELPGRLQDADIVRKYLGGWFILSLAL